MKIFIVTEGGKDIGFGHIMRCIALADAFEEKGMESRLIVNGDKTVNSILRGKKYVIFNWIEDQKRLLRLLRSQSIVIIDSYLAGVGLYRKISKSVKTSVYIDDNNRIKYPRGIVLNGNIYAKSLKYEKTKNITYLLGVDYIPLRKAFWEIPARRVRKKIRNVMISFGGNDARNMTVRVLRILKEAYPLLRKNAVIGRAFTNISKIDKERDKNTNLIFYPDSKKMKELMLKSDVTVSSGGQTLYELARIGVPTIAISVVDNQLSNVKRWEEKGFVKYAGQHNQRNISKNIKHLMKDMESLRVRKIKSKAGRKLVSGRGAQRVVKEVMRYE